jgi:hypothetical protein
VLTPEEVLDRQHVRDEFESKVVEHQTAQDALFGLNGGRQ